nr:hypothetical protein [Lachnospiraceae bacterium]
TISDYENQLNSAKSFFSNSNEYKNVIESVKKLKIKMQNPDMEISDEDYSKGIKEIMDNISMYYKHRAMDKTSGRSGPTEKKLAVCEKIYQDLRESVVKFDKSYRDMFEGENNRYFTNALDSSEKANLKSAKERIENIKKNKAQINKKRTDFNALEAKYGNKNINKSSNIKGKSNKTKNKTIDNSMKI